MTDLAELLVRVQDAIAQDFDLEDDISDSLDMYNHPVDDFTQSFDSACELAEQVLPGWRRLWRDGDVGEKHRHFVNLFRPNTDPNNDPEPVENETYFPTWGPTAALTMTAAILRARIAENNRINFAI